MGCPRPSKRLGELSGVCPPTHEQAQEARVAALDSTQLGITRSSSVSGLEIETVAVSYSVRYASPIAVTMMGLRKPSLSAARRGSAGRKHSELDSLSRFGWGHRPEYDLIAAVGLTWPHLAGFRPSAPRQQE